MQIKITMRYHYPPIRKSKIKKIVITPMLTRMQRNSMTYTLLRVIQNVTATLENSLAVHPTTRNGLTIRPRYCTLQHLSQGNDNLCSGRNLCTNASKFICSCPKLETTQIASNG